MTSRVPNVSALDIDRRCWQRAETQIRTVKELRRESKCVPPPKTPAGISPEIL